MRVQFSDGTTGTIWAESRSELVFDFPNTERFKREKQAFKTNYAKSEITTISMFALLETTQRGTAMQTW